MDKAIDNVPDLPIEPDRPPPDPGPSHDPGPEGTLVAIVQNDVWRALGLPKPHRVYISMQGDVWDMIAIRAYGTKRGNEHLMYRLLEENWPLRDVVIFPAGVPVIIPEIAIDTTIQLVPWKKADQVP
jgi:phage tail protein X